METIAEISGQNPKLAGSNIVDCIPQTGHCPQKCVGCFYNNGFYRTLDEPLIPSEKDIQEKIVRVNSGHDSNIQREKVIEMTKHYPRKFYNTSIYRFDFPGPIVFTCNGGNERETDVSFYSAIDNERVKNIMAVRVRVNTWNLQNVKDAVTTHTKLEIPVLLTFMRYRSYENLKSGHEANYEYKHHIKNSYYCINEKSWTTIVNSFKNNPHVFVCGKEYANSYCAKCGNCEELYNRWLHTSKFSYIN